MSVQIIMDRDIYLDSPVTPVTLTNAIYAGDADAQRIRFRCFQRHGQIAPMDLSEITITAHFIRPDGGDVVISGVGGSTYSYVDLPEACYVYPGIFKLLVRASTSEPDVVTSILYVTGRIDKPTTDVIIDPGTVIPSLEDLLAQIDACEDAADDANAAAADAIAAAAAGVRTDTASQGLSDTQKSNARTNIDAASTADVGQLSDELDHISPDKVSFMVQGKNLFNPYTLKYGVQIHPTTHQEVANEQYASSDYIPVTGGTEYIIRYMSYIFYYDTSKAYVSLDPDTYENRFNFTPAQDGYIRFCNNIGSAANLRNTEHNIVAKATEYYDGMPYTYNFDDGYSGLDDFKKPLNLITSIENGYVRRSDGSCVGPTGRYRSSNMIRIDPDKYYYWYNLRPQFGGFYDQKSQYITAFDHPDSQISLPNPFRASDYVTGAAFVRVTGYSDQIGLYERPIELYEEIGQTYFNESKVNLNAPVRLDVFLPPDFYVPLGHTIEIYNDTLIPLPTTEGLYFKWTGTSNLRISMLSYERKFVVASADDADTAEDYSVTLEIYDKWFNLLFSGSTTIHVVSALSSPKTIVPIGDSITNGKDWLDYIVGLDSNVTFTGTRWHDTGSSFEATTKHEGRSGWRASFYISTFDYQFDDDGLSNTNPFYDTENAKFSLQHYKDTYFHDDPLDGIQFFLGTNGLAISPPSEDDALEKMVTTIRTEYPTMPIFICYPIYTADQNGCARQTGSDGYSSAGGMFYARKKLAMWQYIKRLYERLHGIEKVYFVPVGQNFDHKYMFGITQVRVNQYSQITEPMPTEAVHPDDYSQFIEPMYGAYCYAFNS